MRIGWRDVGAVGLAAAVMTLPCWGALSLDEAFNDKPYGHHVTPVSYVIGAAANVIAAVIARMLAHCTASPGQRAGVFAAWAVVAWLLLVLTCRLWWGDWLTELRDLHGDPVRTGAVQGGVGRGGLV